MDELVCNLHDFYVFNIVKIGYLSKKGHRVANIKERYFILRQDSMDYFTENMRDKKGSVYTKRDKT